MHKSFRMATRTALAAGALLLSCSLSARAAEVHFDTDCSPVLAGFDRALYERAADRTATLRRFIEMRRAFLQKNVYDTAVWAAGVMEGRKACLASRNVAAGTTPTAR